MRAVRWRKTAPESVDAIPRVAHHTQPSQQRVSENPFAAPPSLGNERESIATPTWRIGIDMNDYQCRLSVPTFIYSTLRDVVQCRIGQIVNRPRKAV